MNRRFIALVLLFSINAGAFCTQDQKIEPSQKRKLSEPLNIAILVSGNGSNMEAILRYFEQPEKQGLINVRVVISNRKNAYALKRAQLEVETSFKNAAPIAYLPTGIKKAMTDEEKQQARKNYAQKLINCLEDHGVTRENGLICAAGFMVILHKDFLDHFSNQVINIHPSLLPSFPGSKGIKDAFEYGVKITGPTVHIMDEGMDTGPIIGQKIVHVSDDDNLETLEAKIHKAEHELYPWIIEQIARGRMQVVDKSDIGGSTRSVVMLSDDTQAEA